MNTLNHTLNARPLLLTQRASYAQDRAAVEFGGVPTYDLRVARARAAEAEARRVSKTRATLIGSLLYALGLI